MSNPEVYPETATFEKYWEETIQPFLNTIDADEELEYYKPVVTLYDVMRENLGEYEHGSADVDQVFEGLQVFDYDRQMREDDPDYDDRPMTRQMLQAYRAVCEDVLMSTYARLRG